MHLWGAAELLREFRFLWPVSDCAGLGLGTALLLIVLSWLSGLLTGLLIAAICFSQSCRRLLAPSVCLLSSVIARCNCEAASANTGKVSEQQGCRRAHLEDGRARDFRDETS